MHGGDDEPITLARLERVHATLAYIVQRHGMQYAPLFERIERELAAFRNGGDVLSRARAAAASYAGAGSAESPATAESPTTAASTALKAPDAASE